GVIWWKDSKLHAHPRQDLLAPVLLGEHRRIGILVAHRADPLRQLLRREFSQVRLLLFIFDQGSQSTRAVQQGEGGKTEGRPFASSRSPRGRSQHGSQARIQETREWKTHCTSALNASPLSKPIRSQ